MGVKKYLQHVKQTFFPRKHSPLPSTLLLLKQIYPTVDWERVDFYEGLPWFTSVTSPWVSAQALPSFYSFGRFRIYLTKFDEARGQCLADIVHEGMHVLQAMRFAKGYGVGPFRGFIVYYLSYFFKYGYRKNPFEIPAYDQEFRFLVYVRQKGQHGIHPSIDEGSLLPVEHSSGLIFHKSDVFYKGNIFLLFAGALLAFVIMIGAPLIELLVWIFIRPVRKF